MLVTAQLLMVGPVVSRIIIITHEATFPALSVTSNLIVYVQSVFALMRVSSDAHEEKVMIHGPEIHVH